MISSILQEGYFLLEYSSSASINYRHVNYFHDEMELMDYIKCEFEGTDGEIITKCSVTDLIEGKSYTQTSQQGTEQSVFHVLLVHGNNLSNLFSFLAEIDFEDNEGYQIPLDEMLQSAEDEEEILEIIEYYNYVQDNYW